MLRRSKLFISLVLSILLVFSSFVSFAEPFASKNTQDILNKKISSKVFDKLEKGEEKVEVLVKLKEQADVENIAEKERIKLESNSFELDNNAIKASVREDVVNALEKTAKRTQGNLLSYIQKEKIKGNVKEYESYYIVNMVYVKATKGVIEKIALMDEVEKVYYNEETYLIDHAENPESTIEIIDNTNSSEEEEDVVEGKIEVLNDTSSIEEVNEFKGKIEQFVESENNILAVLPSDIEWNIKQVNADKVWSQYDIDGTGVVVGMIDSGVTWDHPALKNKYRGYNSSTGRVNHNGNWYDAYAGRSTPYDDSSSPHGTHVMGTILGQEASGRNAIGVAPGAKFIVAKGLGPNGGSANQLIRAGEWMLKPGGSVSNAPDIINNSWGGGDGINDWFRDVVRSWRAAGIVPVFAAGNQVSGEPAPWPGSISIPSNYPESFAVAATDSSNRRGSFSKLGPSPYDKSIPKPDISAPGVSIRSSVINGYQSGWSGTSMASPHIAGVAALVLQANPRLSVDQVENTIKSTATPLTDYTYRTSPNMGYGYGLVNALKAVEKVKGGSQPTQKGNITGRVTDHDTGYGISNARVAIQGTSLYAYTDSYGYYTIKDIPVGNYTVVMTATDYTTISGNIIVEANKTLTVNGTMVKEAPIVKTGNITGRVTDYDTGYGISNARVAIQGTSLYAYTDSYGYYTIKDIPVGNYTVVMTATDYTTISGNIIVEANKTLTVNGTMVKEVPIVKTGNITGRVTDYYTGYSIPYAKVQISGTSIYTYSDIYGYFTLEDVPSGDQTIVITCYGYYSVSDVITINPGGTVKVSVRLVPSRYYYRYGENEETPEIELPKIEPPKIKKPIIGVPIVEPPVIEE